MYIYSLCDACIIIIIIVINTRWKSLNRVRTRCSYTNRDTCYCLFVFSFLEFFPFRFCDYILLMLHQCSISWCQRKRLDSFIILFFLPFFSIKLSNIHDDTYNTDYCCCDAVRVLFAKGHELQNHFIFTNIQNIYYIQIIIYTIVFLYIYTIVNKYTCIDNMRVWVCVCIRNCGNISVPGTKIQMYIIPWPW